MNQIDQYNFAFGWLVKSFVEKYYKNDEGDIAEFFVIGEGGDLCPDIVEVNEMYRHITDIYTAIKNNIPQDKLFTRYDYSLNKHTINKQGGDEVIVNLYNFAFGPTEYTEEQKAIDEAKVKEIYHSLMEECEKNKSEDQKAKDDIEKEKRIFVDTYLVRVYDVRKALQEYDILHNT